MDAILRFFSETLILQWLRGQQILDLFNQYFISQSEANQVLIIMGVGILAVLGSLQLIKIVLKMTLLWVKVLLFAALTYYLFVVILGIDIWAFVRL